MPAALFVTKVPAGRDIRPWRRAGGAEDSRVREREMSTMARTDTHFEGMLRHLGAAYYDSLQGNATQADVNRAVDTVAEHLNEVARPPADGTDAASRRYLRGTGQDAGSTGGPAGSVT